MAARERYTHGHHESVLRSHTWRTIANSAAYLAPHLVGVSHVLDVGCGPGTITAEMADGVGLSGTVTGMDASAEVVELKRIAAAWRAWASGPDAWFAILHGEILASV